MPVSIITYIFGNRNIFKLEINDVYGCVPKHLNNFTVHVSNILGTLKSSKSKITDHPDKQNQMQVTRNKR